jgi:hypothetical protein
MKRDYSPETLSTVNGNGAFRRTQLHVDFGPGPGFVSAEKIEDHGSEERFNAIGSIVPNRANSIHLPVIDVDGGVKVQNKPFRGSHGFISKAILVASHKGEYTPDSELRDVLGDYGIDLEVFQAPNLEPDGYMMESYRLNGARVGSIVLRSRQFHNFETVASTTKGHSHLYIQEAFHDEDHKTLINELGRVGIVSPEWQQLTEQEGMSIVRTPWTKRNILRHRLS